MLHCNCCLSSCWLTWVIISLYSALISLHLDSVSSFVPQDSRKVWEYSVCLEKDHQDGQALNIYLKDRLRAHGLFSLENRRFRGDLVAAFQCLQGDNWKDGARLSTEIHGRRTRDNGHRPLQLEINKQIKLGERPWEVTESLSLGFFKVWLDKALNNMVWIQCCPCLKQEAESPKVRFILNDDSIIHGYL